MSVLTVLVILFLLALVYVGRNSKFIPNSHLIVGGAAVFLLGFWPIVFLVADVYFAKRRVQN